MNEQFNFRSEVLEKYDGDEEVYEVFSDAFCSLMLAADIENNYICMHGGISPELTCLDDINQLDRFIEVPHEGLFCDLLWSDPCKDSNHRKVNFESNNARECSYIFGLRAVAKLCNSQNYLSIIRAHEV